MSATLQRQEAERDRWRTRRAGSVSLAAKLDCPACHRKWGLRLSLSSRDGAADLAFVGRCAGCGGTSLLLVAR